MNEILTKHAKERMVKRAIPPLIVDWLMTYGNETHAADGANIHFFDKKCRKKLKSTIGALPYSRLEDQMECYLVAKDGVVLTVGHRSKKIKR